MRDAAHYLRAAVLDLNTDRLCTLLTLALLMAAALSVLKGMTV